MTKTRAMPGRLLRQWRDTLGWTQAELADALYVDVGQISRWENGRVPLRANRRRQLAALAKAQRVPPPFLEDAIDAD